MCRRHLSRLMQTSLQVEDRGCLIFSFLGLYYPTSHHFSFSIGSQYLGYCAQRLGKQPLEIAEMFSYLWDINNYRILFRGGITANQIIRFLNMHVLANSSVTASIPPTITDQVILSPHWSALLILSSLWPTLLILSSHWSALLRLTSHWPTLLKSLLIGQHS